MIWATSYFGKDFPSKILWKGVLSFYHNDMQAYSSMQILCSHVQDLGPANLVLAVS